jgi:hypothetical protein
MAERKSRRKISLGKSPLTLFDVMRADPTRVAQVLRRHGVYFDPGTFLTLSAAPEKAAAYHAVRDRGAFLRDLLG